MVTVIWEHGAVSTITIRINYSTSETEGTLYMKEDSSTTNLNNAYIKTATWQTV